MESGINKTVRINEEIRVPEIRLIGPAGEQIGVMPLKEAIKIAKERGVDVVEVSPTAVPPVCRMLDFGKFKYEQQKKRKESRKNQKEMALTEVRLKPRIEEHDIEFKMRQIKKLLNEGNKVKISVNFRGREITHPHIGFELLQRIKKTLEESTVVERAPSMDGKRMIIILAPETIKHPKENKTPEAIKQPKEIKTPETVKHPKEIKENAKVKNA